MRWEELNKINKKYGDSFYIIEPNSFSENYTSLLSSFRKYYHNTHIGYSYKTNYLPYYCKMIGNLGGYAEVVSDFEYSLAIKYGVHPAKIIVNGPYKKQKDLHRYLLNQSIVNLDSFYEIENLLALAESNPNEKYSVGVRCNFAVAESQISRFGFDVENEDVIVALRSLANVSNIEIKGLHCHYPNRDLDSFRIRISELLKLSETLLSATPEYLDIGGGYFGKMEKSLAQQFKGDIPDFAQYGEIIGSKIDDYYAGYKPSDKPKLFIEPGSAIVANTIKYIVKILDIKNIRGQDIAMTTGSRFNMGMFSSPIVLPMKRYSKYAGELSSSNFKSIHISGYTCIENDYLAMDYSGPLKVGDYLEFSNVGSYSLVFKPPFILPNCSILKYNGEKDGYIELKRAESMDDIMRTYNY